MDEDDANNAGYGKPPAHSQFKPGQSGNPKGRPKGCKNLRTEVEEELSQMIRIRENGKDLRVSKRAALIKAQINKGITKGDSRAAELIFLLANPEPNRESTEAQQPSSEDDAILQDLINRKMRQAEGAAGNPNIFINAITTEPRREN